MRHLPLFCRLVVCLAVCLAAARVTHAQDRAGWMPGDFAALVPAAGDWGDADAMDVRFAFAQAEAPTASTAQVDAADAGLPAGSPFARGTWTVHTYGSTTVWASPQNHIYTAHLGAGYHIRDRVSINLEAFGGAADPTADGNDHTGVGGLDLLVRWHFKVRDNWSLYMDGGAGVQWAGADYPSDSRGNFRPQFGIGATVRLADHVRFMGGARWLHISNAGTSEINNGLDALQLYAGVMVPF